MKRTLVKRAIREMAKRKGYSIYQLGKVTSDEIMEYMKENGHDRFFTPSGITCLRRGLPKMYK
jgi:hypothetical protein